MKKFLLLLCSLAVVGYMLYHTGFFTYIQSGSRYVDAGRVEVDHREYSRSPAGDQLQTPPTATVFLPDENAYEGSPYLQQFVTFQWPLRQQETIRLWQGGITRAIDRIVTAVNRGNIPVYVRTVFAFEQLEATVWKNVCSTGSRNGMVFHGSVEIHGSMFDLYSYTYDQPLQPGESTMPSLLQVVLDRNTTAGDLLIIQQGYEIMSSTQACQASGLPKEFGEAPEASVVLDAMLGEITLQQHPWVGQ